MRERRWNNKWFKRTLSMLMCFCMVVGLILVEKLPAQAVSSTITVTPDAAGGKVKVLIQNPGLNGIEISVVCYEPGWNQNPLDMESNLNAMSYIGQYRGANGKAEFEFKLKSNPVAGEYALTIGSAVETGSPRVERFRMLPKSNSEKELETLTKQFGELKKDGYTTQSWADFEKALNNAKDALVHPYEQRIVAALSALKQKKEALKADVSGLTTLINRYKSLDKKLYTSASWTAFEKALKTAENVSKNAKATPAQVNTALNALKKTYGGLVKRPKVGTTFTYQKGKYRITGYKSSGATVTFLKPTNKTLTSFTVPATVKYVGSTYKVTAIANKAFYKNAKLKTVKIGTNVSKIGKQAFQNDRQLNNIIFQRKKVPTFGQNVFKGISEKAKFTIPKKNFAAYKKALLRAKAKDTMVFRKK